MEGVEFGMYPIPVDGLRDVDHLIHCVVLTRTNVDYLLLILRDKSFHALNRCIDHIIDIGEVPLLQAAAVNGQRLVIGATGNTFTN